MSLLSKVSRHRAFAELGIKILVEIPFDASLADLNPNDFLCKLEQNLNLKGIIVGYDFRFGRNRQGGAEELSAFLKGKDLYFCQVAPLELNGHPISSTRIREI